MIKNSTAKRALLGGGGGPVWGGGVGVGGRGTFLLYCLCLTPDWVRKTEIKNLSGGGGGKGQGGLQVS